MDTLGSRKSGMVKCLESIEKQGGGFSFREGEMYYFDLSGSKLQVENRSGEWVLFTPELFDRSFSRVVAPQAGHSTNIGKGDVLDYALRDHPPFAYDLIPRRALAKVAMVMHNGREAGRPDEGWKEFNVRQQVNHAISHLVAYLEGDRRESHLANAACRVLFALDMDREDPMPRPQRRSEYDPLPSP